MGDYFDTVVDVDATAEDAPRLAAEVLSWLVAEGIVEPEPSAPAFDIEGDGYAPGPQCGKAFRGDPDRALGLSLHVGRTVFDAGQGDPEAVTCPHCSARVELMDEDRDLDDEAWGLFAEAVQTWAGSEDPAPVRCPSCGTSAPVHRWIWADDHFAFGHLGFAFWNWDALRPEFVAELTRRLGGHRSVELEGKL
ncbi:hypothetical protein [Streptomyces chattanoogensis]|uniref:Uncharacterized protein n=1 Tax=Streptomyces chattanoogensis TaxID=66876 RepID=A0A0N1JZT4_9ACTN|nr:hypothetical protein [Streptomyces chattanoogensis]KPC66203.1 hypothetical protein ADL29_04400 [Streptomyces chattanoogensis]